MALKIKGGQVKSAAALKKSLKKGGGGANYMKRVPKDDSITVRFLTEPEEWFEYLEYFSEEDKFFPAVEGMDPEFVADLNPPSKRWLAPAVDVSDNSVVPIVLPKSLVQSIMKKYEKYKTVLDRDYELTREGEGFDTSYEAIPEPPSKMNLRRFTPPDLLEVLEAAVPEALGGGGDNDDEDDVDFDEADDETPIRTRKRPVKKTRTIRKRVKDEPEPEEKKPIRKKRLRR